MADLNNLTTLAKRLRPLLKLGFGVAGGGHIIEDEVTSLPNRKYLDFVGDGVTATDDEVNDATVVTVPGGGEGGNCNRWIDGSASWDSIAGTTYDKEKDGWFMPYGCIRRTAGWWKVPVGCSGEICIWPVFVLKPGVYGGDLRSITEVDLASCGGNFVPYTSVQAGDEVTPDEIDQVIFCPGYPITSFVVTEGNIIKLVVRICTVDDDPNPFTEDCWFLGWEIKYGTCPERPE